MKQQTFSDMEYSNRKRKTRREDFLDAMNEIIPWEEWIEYIRPFYPKGERGRPPRGIELMLRMYLLQTWFTLSDEMCEETIYDSYAFRKFTGIDFFDEQVPDATTLLKFRHMLDENNIPQTLFGAINSTLEQGGQIMRGGSIVDAVLINAPSSTKNAKRERDPEMHQTKKGNQWYFGMKAHIGVDAGSGYVHSMEATAANEHDITATHALIREDDTVVYGDSGYTGIEKREEIKNSEHLSNIDWRINQKRSKVKNQWDASIERQKSSVRSKVEHPFRIVKCIFGYTKAVYKGIQKNKNRLYMLFGSANLLMCIWSGGLREPIPNMG